MKVTVFYCETNPRGMEAREVDVPGLDKPGAQNHIIATTPFVKQSLSIARRVVMRYYPRELQGSAKIIIHWQMIPTDENAGMNVHFYDGTYIQPEYDPTAWPRAWAEFNRRAIDLMSLAAPDEE